jgi:translation elongation factor EF-4
MVYEVKWLWVGVCRMEIITPKDYVGPIMELAQQRRGEFIDMTYLTETRTTLVYDLPLAEVRACS